ncbi:uncharacterized protein K452DRAFT_165701 [Aplosporella prunicola CBS 121167]|uniref:Zn(2)-C6 fungal-type domain-containing protein n=1 Tax=Aplosporella prunicola CBS 121167 TaxID=1176127 RepID=A0A6A6AXQ3_9PEZI|nr:uncharacterized protein K452DRAFT_173279 [Aplosporella prunicola CBS 121167]XP_033391415.1 uncharacterized protein K452DRAFT_165701 [Aplosporella prunicola CBS 121167]KAF2135557.1 hypothetical protein K452DRAFT_173279 [Aplosporella prunicola CBS 121167]KAF2135697.1 hypothetical protein K452DRAFT_165701 [Aplosporella prunicola CBS 121167]
MYPHHSAAPSSHWASPSTEYSSPQPQPAARPYPPPPPQLHPPTLQEPRPDMTSLQQQQPYRLPAPHQMYPGPTPPDPYRQPPPPHALYQQHQPAPRQRTAIACRYCRRRKIRCSGFEASEDGRCTNCVRFSQECIFTPVSAQTQAFVPAHTVWRGGGAPPPLYGAYGQPLPATQPTDPYGAPPRPQPGYPLPSPTASSTASYQSAPHPQAQPYYAPQPPRRSSPQSAYSYDPSRASSSPHTQGAPSTPGSSYTYSSDATLRPPSSIPIRQDGRTPPPPTSSAGTPAAGGSRAAMRISDMVSGGDSGRSAADADMLNALNRRGM